MKKSVNFAPINTATFRNARTEFIKGFMQSSSEWTAAEQEAAHQRISFGEETDYTTTLNWPEEFAIIVADKAHSYAFKYHHDFSISAKKMKVIFLYNKQSEYAQDPFANRQSKHYVHSKSFFGGVVINEPITTLDETNWFNVGLQAGVAMQEILEAEPENIDITKEYFTGKANVQTATATDDDDMDLPF